MEAFQEQQDNCLVYTTFLPSVILMQNNGVWNIPTCARPHLGPTGHHCAVTDVVAIAISIAIIAAAVDQIFSLGL
jgi:hypothetical protein